VEQGLAYLLKMRAADPYHSLLPRYVYEHPPGGAGSQAPSFKIQQLSALGM
jgi:hypothetical protein